MLVDLKNEQMYTKMQLNSLTRDMGSIDKHLQSMSLSPTNPSNISIKIQQQPGILSSGDLASKIARNGNRNRRNIANNSRGGGLVQSLDATQHSTRNVPVQNREKQFHSKV